MLFIVHVIMGTNESLVWLFCVDKWVKDQGQNWLLESSHLKYLENHAVHSITHTTIYYMCIKVNWS